MAPANLKARSDGTARMLCFLIAMIEGFDLQAAGVVSANIAKAFQLGPGEMAWFFSAATIGLTIGALVGGRIADKFGRKLGLMLAIAMFGTSSIAVSLAWNYESLLLVRLLTGVGLGGALPILVAITAEASLPELSSRNVAVTYSGMPAGGAIAGFVSLVSPLGSWATVFIVGGIAPLVLLPVVGTSLQIGKQLVASKGERSASGIENAFFGKNRTPLTLLLWGAFFFGLLIMYLLLNWLPTLLQQKGFDHSTTGFIQISFNAVGALCSIGLGAVAGRYDGANISLCAFGILILSLLALSLAPAATNLIALLIVGIAAATSGAMVVAIQSILYATAPKIYPEQVRGTGVGAAVAMGRIGSIVGPLLAGFLLAGGRTANDVFLALVPIAAIAGISTMALLRLQVLAAKEPSSFVSRNDS
ncbi:MAG: MFS transporter [Sphingobium sp.]